MDNLIFIKVDNTDGTMTSSKIDPDLMPHALNQINDGTICDSKHRLVLKSTYQTLTTPKTMTSLNKCTYILVAT